MQKAELSTTLSNVYIFGPAGLFLAPQMVGEALKSGRLIAQAMTAAGCEVVPSPGMPEVLSYITAVQLNSRERMVAFCQAVQACCPVGSYIQPTPGMPFVPRCMGVCTMAHGPTLLPRAEQACSIL